MASSVRFEELGAPEQLRLAGQESPLDRGTALALALTASSEQMATQLPICLERTDSSGSLPSAAVAPHVVVATGLVGDMMAEHQKLLGEPDKTGSKKASKGPKTKKRNVAAKGKPKQQVSGAKQRITPENGPKPTKPPHAKNAKDLAFPGLTKASAVAAPFHYGHSAVYASGKGWRLKLFQGDKHEAYYGRTREGWTELVKKIKEINN